MGVEYRHFLIPRPNSFRPEPEQLEALVAKLVREGWLCNPEHGALPTEGMNIAGLADGVSKTGTIAITDVGTADAPFPLNRAWLADHFSSDLILSWKVENPEKYGLCYPFTEQCSPTSEELYYDIQIHLSPDYINQANDDIKGSCGNCATLLVGQPESEKPKGFFSRLFSPPPPQPTVAAGIIEEDNIFNAVKIARTCPNCGQPVDVSSWKALVRDGWSGCGQVVTGGGSYLFAVVIDCGNCIPADHTASVRPELIGLLQQQLGCDFYEIGEIY